MAKGEAHPIDFNKVAIHTNIIDRSNVLHLSLVLQKLMKECDAIAIDTEFTGLGDNIYTSSKAPENGRRVRPGMEDNLEERYESYCRVVREHALVSLGLTLFKKIAVPTKHESTRAEGETDSPAKKKAKKSKKNKKDKKHRAESDEESDNGVAPCQDTPRYRASNFEFILFCQVKVYASAY